MNKFAQVGTLIKTQGKLSGNQQRFMIKQSLILVVSLILSTSVIAESYYVDDTLRIGVRAKPDKSLPSIVVIQSGTAVEIIEKQANNTKIRLSNGVEGWVTSAYLTNKLPAINKLKQATQQIDQLEAQIKSLSTDNATDSTLEKTTLQAQITALENEKQSLQAQLSDLSNKSLNVSKPVNVSNTTSQLSLTTIDKNTIYFLAGTIVVLLFMGFLFGVSWHKKQVTKRLGGISI